MFALKMDMLKTVHIPRYYVIYKVRFAIFIDILKSIEKSHRYVGNSVGAHTPTYIV